MDPDQINHFGGVAAGVLAFIGIVILAFIVFYIFLFWRICTKAGLAGALSLLILIPGIGFLILLCILAFSEWKVVPVPDSPYYPPPPSYPPPPQVYPPPPPPAQL
jgi:hypothetical protein